MFTIHAMTNYYYPYFITIAYLLKKHITLVNFVNLKPKTLLV